MISRKSILTWPLMPFFLFLMSKISGQPNMVFFEHFDEEHGLPNNVFTQVIQDKQGLLWMSGADGLARYDGYSIKEIRHNQSDPYSISGNKISKIYEDSKGRLWIATLGSGINFSDPTKSKFFTVQDSLDPAEKAMYHLSGMTQDSLGRIWIASNRGIEVLEEEKGVFTYSKDRKLLELIAGCDMLDDPTILITGKADELWIGTQSGLCMYDSKKQMIYCPEDFQGLPHSVINEIGYDRKGKLWIGCVNAGPRLFYNDGSFFQFHPFDKIPLTPKASIQFSFDLDNRLWLSSFANEAYAYDFRDSILFLQTGVNSNISHERFIRKPFIDHSGDVWLPCEGFYIYRYPKGISYYHHPYSFFQSNSSIYGVGDTLWLGYREKGLVRLIENTGKTDLFSSESEPDFRIISNNVVQISRLKSGNKILVGFGDLSIMGPDDRIIKSYEVKGTNRGMFEDSHGRIWTGGYRGLHLFSEDKGVIKTYTMPGEQGEGGNFIQTITEDTQGNIWFGSDIKGLEKLDPVTEQVEQFLPDSGNPHSLPSVGVTDIAFDQSGILWVGTDVALVRFDPITYNAKSYDKTKGLENDYICSVLCDKGLIWVSTHAGISSFDPVKEEFVNYTRRDGLTNLHYHNRVKFISKEGVIYFGGKNGVDYFNPSTLRKNPTPPIMYLSGITIDNRKKLAAADVSELGEIKLTPSNNVMEIEFIGLHYTDQADVKYQYMLDGLNEEWSDLGHERKILLTHMKPGNYSFRARAITPDLVSSEKELEIPIRVIPPFYSTQWFRILAFCFLIGLLIAYFRYRELMIKRKDKREADIQHKINELEKKALQAQMNPHFIFNSMNSIQQFMIVNDTEGAMKYLTRFSRILRTVLNMSAESRIPLSDEIKLIEDYLELENMRFPNKFDYTIHVSPEINIHAVEIPPFFIQPQVENAIRHGLLKKSTQGHLLVEIQKEGHNMRIIVEDNGIGREEANKVKFIDGSLHESKGLAIVEERLKHLHSENGLHEIKIIDLYNESKEPKGTRVEISLPLED